MDYNIKLGFKYKYKFCDLLVSQDMIGKSIKILRNIKLDINTNIND